MDGFFFSFEQLLLFIVCASLGVFFLTYVVSSFIFKWNEIREERRLNKLLERRNASIRQ
ncbi:MAG: hypothetical protein ACRCWQ_03275 [Bacilli bacterium]